MLFFVLSFKFFGIIIRSLCKHSLLVFLKHFCIFMKFLNFLLDFSLFTICLNNYGVDFLRQISHSSLNQRLSSIFSLSCDNQVLEISFHVISFFQLLIVEIQKWLKSLFFILFNGIDFGNQFKDCWWLLIYRTLFFILLSKLIF